MHLVILQHIEKPTDAPQVLLELNISLWEMKLDDETIDELTRAVLVTVIFVAKKLHKDMALLLPHAVTVFLENYSNRRWMVMWCWL